MTAVEVSENMNVAPVDALAGLVDDEFIARLAAQARAQGLSLVGAGGVLQQLTNQDRAEDTIDLREINYGEHGAGRWLDRHFGQSWPVRTNHTADDRDGLTGVRWSQRDRHRVALYDNRFPRDL